MKKGIEFAATAAALALLTATPAEAAITYGFESIEEQLTFSYTTNDFISSDTFLSAAMLDNCNCDRVSFELDASGSDQSDTVAFTVLGGGTTFFFFFADGSFEALGTHNSIEINQGTLTISGPASVPEPATWVMMLLGFGAVGFAMRHRKQTELTFRRAA